MYKRRIHQQTNTPTRPHRGPTPLRKQWRPEWQLDSTIVEYESGPAALQAYKQRSQTPRQIRRKTHPNNPITMEGWRSDVQPFSTTPINPDLDIHSTNRYKLTQHPTKPTHTTLHIPDGTLICKIDNRRLDKLYNICNNAANNLPFEKSLAQLIQKNERITPPEENPKGTTI